MTPCIQRPGLSLAVRVPDRIKHFIILQNPETLRWQLVGKPTEFKDVYELVTYYGETPTSTTDGTCLKYPCPRPASEGADDGSTSVFSTHHTYEFADLPGKKGLGAAKRAKQAKLSQSPIRGDSLVLFGGEGIYGALAKMGYNTFSLSRVASAGTPGAPPTHEELYASLKETRGQGPLTREELYARCATYASIVASKEAYEETKMKKMSPEEKQAVLVNANEEMGKHCAAYEKLFVPWSSESWIGFLKDKHGELMPHFVSNPAQPNPWESEGIDTKSKHYLIKLMEVFEDTSASSPTTTVEDVCTKVVGILGDDVAEFRCGPLKKRSRVFEKVLMLDGRFDCIRDYARNYIVIKKGHFTDMAMVPTLLARQEEVEMVRAKNRFDPDYDPKQTAGYRDYQIILKTKEGWLVEVQVIPEEMLELKETLSHEVYTEYRFIMEAAKRGGFGDFSQYDLLADLTTDLDHEDRYDLFADLIAEPDSVGGGVGDKSTVPREQILGC